jgi:hypothetical protein
MLEILALLSSEEGESRAQHRASAQRDAAAPMAEHVTTIINPLMCIPHAYMYAEALNSPAAHVAAHACML